MVQRKTPKWVYIALSETFPVDGSGEISKFYK